jgi:hypothetical protein
MWEGGGGKGEAEHGVGVLALGAARPACLNTLVSSGPPVDPPSPSPAPLLCRRWWRAA